MGAGSDLFGFGLGAMVAPEIVVVEGLEIFADGDDAGAGGVESDGSDAFAGDAGFLKDGAGGADKGLHLVVMRLGGEVGIFAAAVEWVLRGGGADGALLAVDEGYADTQGAEVYAGDDRHGAVSEKTITGTDGSLTHHAQICLESVTMPLKNGRLREPVSERKRQKRN